MIIRQENTQDYGEVYSVVRSAFAEAEHSDGTEQDLVTALRKSAAFVPELSLVAVIEGRIAGHIMFTRAEVGDKTVLALAPLSVRPGDQKKGVGTALIREGHRIARKLGYEYSVVLGSDKYYPREGYIPAKELGIQAPFEVPSENFMALRLTEDADPVCGILKYAPEFGI